MLVGSNKFFLDKEHKNNLFDNSLYYKGNALKICSKQFRSDLCKEETFAFLQILGSTPLSSDFTKTFDRGYEKLPAQFFRKKVLFPSEPPYFLSCFDFYLLC